MKGKKERKEKDKKKKLKITVKAEWLKPKEGDTASFNCKVEHNLDFGPKVTWEGFVVDLPFIVKTKGRIKHEFDPRIARMDPHINMTFSTASDLRASIQSDMFLELAPISYALRSSEFTEDEYNKLIDLFFPDINAEVNLYFGNLLKELLEEIGYVVTIEVIEPGFYVQPTIDHTIQRIYTSDKRGTFLTDLMELKRKADNSFPLMLDEQTGENIVGIKIDVSIPSKRAHGEKAQLRFDFDFQEQDGFKLIPVKDLETPETIDKLNNLLTTIERDIAKGLSPTTLRVKDAIICLSQLKGGRSFDYTEGELMDLLYKKENRKTGKEYHSSGNKNRVRDNIQLISKLRFTYAVKIGRSIVGIDDIPYIILNPEGKPFVEYQTKKGNTKKKYNYQSIKIPERYWKLFSDKQFLAQFKIESLKLQGNKYALYKYLTSWWRIGWERNKGIYEWTLDDILTGAGIAIPPRSQKARWLKKFINDLNEMKKAGFIGKYRQLDKNRDPIKDRWHFEAPEELKRKLKNIGEDYHKKQEIKELREEKKKLKLKQDVIDLKKGGKENQKN